VPVRRTKREKLILDLEDKRRALEGALKERKAHW
jgi:hypothetical protein